MAVGGQGDDAIELKAARAVLLDVIELGAREHHPIPSIVPIAPPWI